MNRAQFLQHMKSIATLGTLGYGIAPGTVATLVTLPFVCVLKFLMPLAAQLAVLLMVTIASYFIIEYALHLLPFSKDPSQIVLDEVVGCAWAFSLLQHPSGAQVVIGFCLFRFLDIYKPAGIHAVQQLPRAWGIIADDLLAAAYTALFLYLYVHLT